MKAAFIVAFLGLAALAHCKEIGIRNFQGYQVLTATATTKPQYETLVKLLQNDELDFWTEPRIGKTDIMASPEQIELLTQLLKTEGMDVSVKIENVGRTVDEQRVENNKLRSLRAGTFAWDVYEPLDAIHDWVASLDELDIATVTTIGQSYEGRPIHMVRVSTGAGANDERKPAVLIDSNLHAREWISGAVGTWILNELTSKPEDYSELLDNFDFYIIPMANPDGYLFTQEDRMWRKTRSVNADSSCRGCDPNRNFAFHFGGESTSSSPCSDLFKGPEAFSEPETAAIRDALAKLQSETTVFAYYTLHSYAQLWLLSWGYTQGVYPPDYDELLAWGNESIDALYAVHRTEYEAGQGADMLYGVGGASDDYAKSEGVKYVATIELRDTGNWGFLLPPAQIIPTAEETIAAIRVLATRANKKIPKA